MYPVKPPPFPNPTVPVGNGVKARVGIDPPVKSSIPDDVGIAEDGLIGKWLLLSPCLLLLLLTDGCGLLFFGGLVVGSLGGTGEEV